MPTPSLQVLEGVFYRLNGNLVVEPSGGVTHTVTFALAPLEGRDVEISLYHLPPTPPTRSPGFGSCLWGEECPCGHSEDPTWLFKTSLKGVLGRGSNGTWTVGTEPLQIEKYMPGHRGQLVVYAEGEVNPYTGADDLFAEAQGLIDTLKGLRKSMGDS